MLLGLSHVYTSFWCFGLLNNVLYVVILSAAADLVDPATPKATVLLADVLPSFLVKLSAPFYIHLIPYQARLGALVGLNFSGMLFIAYALGFPIRLFGVILSSLAGGMGEITFLQLTHYYGPSAINGFSSGTGGAGLVGSFVYLLLTTWIGLSPRVVLGFMSVVPFAFLAVYFLMLPKRDYALVNGTAPLEDPVTHAEPWSFSALDSTIMKTLSRIKPLVKPYIIPLTTVYLGEYTINQGIAPTLLFDLKDMPIFREYRDAYVTYGTCYQLGVFISRSSAPWFRVRKLYTPAILQTVNVLLCLLQSLYMWIPSVWLIFPLMIYEGLLGGLAYVNTYMLVAEEVRPSDREFSMGAVGMSDSAGVVTAALVSMWLEKALCRYQIGTGRPWCNLR